MDSTAAALARVNAFARVMSPELPAVEVALSDLRTMLAGAGVPYALVGGLAVIHHGYVRATRDVDLLFDPEGAARALPLLADAGFERRGARRWRHLGTGVDVDLLAIEAALQTALWPRLSRLREDALEERHWRDRHDDVDR